MKKQTVPVIIAAIIKDKNKFLMTKRVHLDPEDYAVYHNAWQLPGGGIEFIVYLCKLKNPKAKIALDNEASEYGWFTVREARKLKTISATVEILEDALKVSVGERT